MTLDPILLGVLLVVLTAGAFVNGMVGFGFALLAVNVLAAVVGAKQGIVVMSLLTPSISAYQLWYNRVYSDTWKRLRLVLLSAVVGSIVGANLLVILPAWAISLALGAFTVEFVIETMRRERPPMAAGTERRLAPIAGLFSGMTNAALGASGPIIGSYLIAIGLRGREFAFGISLVFFSQGLVRGALYLGLGQYTVALVVAGLLLIAPCMVGQRVGLHFQGRVNPAMFRRIILIVLLLSSANMLWVGIQGLLKAVG